MSLLKWECRAARLFQMNRIGILVMTNMADGSQMIAEPLNLKRREPHTQIESTLTLSLEEAQHLADELWDCGIRPSGAAGSAGAMAAVERHLQDMRSIAAGLLVQHNIELIARP